MTDLSNNDMNTSSADEWKPVYPVESTVVSYRRNGEGMNCYVIYIIHSKIDLPEFQGEVTVERRFSDFIGLYDRLCTKLMHYGYFIPNPPQKEVTTTQKTENFAFLVKRKASLDQFIKLLCSHHYFHKDSLLIEFLTKTDPLPRTAKAVSTAGIFKFMGKVATAVELKRFREPDPDEWFSEALAKVTSVEADLKGLYYHLSHMASYRKEMSESIEAAGASVALLSSSEDTSCISHAISSLSQTEQDISRIYEDIFVSDVYLAENYNTYLLIIDSIKKAFHERTKLFKGLKTACATLEKKTEQLSKAETLNRLDKLDKAKEELEEAKTAKNMAQKDFDFISSNIKKEMEIFENMKDDYFRKVMKDYLESLLAQQTKISTLWEGFQDAVDSLD